MTQARTPSELPAFSPSTSATVLTAEQVSTALTAACRAPSLHNSQPWTFHVGPDHLSVSIDERRLLHGADPDGREARISCGAAAFNLRTALVDLGLATTLSIPTSGDAPLARVDVTGHRPPLEHERDLARALWRRATNRRPFSDTEIPLDTLCRLQDAATAEGAVLTIVNAPGLRERIRTLSNQALVTQREDPLWMADWAAWTGRDGTADGVPAAAAGLPPSQDDLWNRRDYGSRDRTGHLPGKDYEHEPVIAVLSTWDDFRSTQVRAGLALQRVLLAATVHGLAASFLSQTVEVPGARAALRGMLKYQLQPQVVLRLGYGTPAALTPRRPYGDCLDNGCSDAESGEGSLSRRD